LTKREIRENTLDLISDGFQRESLLQFRTGGSTGKPLTLYADEECSEFRNACAWRSDRWAGWELGEPIGAVWGNSTVPSAFAPRLRHWLLTPYIFLDTMALSESAVVKFAKDWAAAQPTLLFGHAHSLYLLALHMRTLKLKSIRPKGIVSSSMALIPAERDVIESTFGMRVFDRYGCEEVSLIASECEKHNGLHINSDHVFVEFIKDDNTPAKPGEQGRIVVTDLLNKAMPLIRYVVEDVGVPSDRWCGCGRGLPLMEGVVGRIADFLTKRDGTKVAGISLIENTLTKIPGIEQLQIVQEASNVITLNAVPNADFTPERERQLIGYFRSLFGEDTQVFLNCVVEIPREASGKYRFAINKLEGSRF
jgi:phenylacetate-CoA ligase